MTVWTTHQLSKNFTFLVHLFTHSSTVNLDVRGNLKRTRKKKLSNNNILGKSKISLFCT